jgi:hypothetical protein
MPLLTRLDDRPSIAVPHLKPRFIIVALLTLTSNTVSLVRAMLRHAPEHFPRSRGGPPDTLTRLDQGAVRCRSLHVNGKASDKERRARLPSEQAIEEAASQLRWNARTNGKRLHFDVRAIVPSHLDLMIGSNIVENE